MRCAAAWCCCVLLLMLSHSTLAQATPHEVYLRVYLDSPAQLEELSELVSIDALSGRTVNAYTSSQRLPLLRQRRYRFALLPHPGKNPGARMGLSLDAKSRRWDAYPTYQEYVALMQGWASSHPEICRLEVVGATTNIVRPHQLLALVISDNPGVAEDEPEVLLTATMHGDETVGYTLLLRLIDELLTGYDPTSPVTETHQLSRIVDETELWILPLANPDGTYFASDDSVDGAIRSFVFADGSFANLDPNRNYPDPRVGEHPDGNVYWQETQAMMTLATDHHFILSANYHGGVEVVNYPWDTWARRHTDDAWFVAISRRYAEQVQAVASAPPYYDVTYFRDLDEGITNGYDWYQVAGGRQDFMTYFHHGRETTIEVSATKNPPASTLPTFWDYHKQAMLTYIGQALTGVRGVVVDDQGAPLDARVELALHDTAADASFVRTDPAAGDYHRMLLPGRYYLVFKADGHLPEVREATVLQGSATHVDVALAQDQGLQTSLSGVVTDALSTRALPGATVQLLAPTQEQRVSTSDGFYSFPVLAEATYLLEASAPGYISAYHIVTVRYPSAVADLTLLPASSLHRRPRSRAR